MNTYTKYCPNVFVAKCNEQHAKGDIITMTTKYCKEHKAIIFNLLQIKDGFYYYSIVREDGFNQQEWAKRRAERLEKAAQNSDRKSVAYWQASHEGREFLALGEPIKVGHHSEKRHRALIERNWDRMGKSVEFGEKAENQRNRAEYWSERANVINLSMPESLEYYEFALDEAKRKHEGLKNGTIERGHSFSLTYAKKEVNELEQKFKLAGKLWG
jgi:hypothetical protein